MAILINVINFFSIFAATDKTLKKTIVIVPVFFQNKSAEYEYLSDIIREAFRSKFESNEIFNLVKLSEIEEKAKILLFNNNEDYINQKKLIKLSSALKADLLIMPKYAVIKNNIMISADVIEVATSKDITSISINGTIGPDMFNCIDSVSLNLEKKIAALYEINDKSLNSELIYYSQD